MGPVGAPTWRPPWAHCTARRCPRKRNSASGMQVRCHTSNPRSASRCGIFLPTIVAPMMGPSIPAVALGSAHPPGPVCAASVDSPSLIAGLSGGRAGPSCRRPTGRPAGGLLHPLGHLGTPGSPSPATGRRSVGQPVRTRSPARLSPIAEPMGWTTLGPRSGIPSLLRGGPLDVPGAGATAVPLGAFPNSAGCAPAVPALGPGRLAGAC